MARLTTDLWMAPSNCALRDTCSEVGLSFSFVYGRKIIRRGQTTCRYVWIWWKCNSQLLLKWLSMLDVISIYIIISFVSKTIPEILFYISIRISVSLESKGWLAALAPRISTRRGGFRLLFSYMDRVWGLLKATTPRWYHLRPLFVLPLCKFTKEDSHRVFLWRGIVRVSGLARATSRERSRLFGFDSALSATTQFVR